LASADFAHQAADGPDAGERRLDVEEEIIPSGGQAADLRHPFDEVRIVVSVN